MFEAPIVICNHDHRFLIAEQLREAGIENARIVLEPAGRNSAPAIAAAALLAAESDPDAVLWIMAADAVMTRPETLEQLLPVAAAAAQRAISSSSACIRPGRKPVMAISRPASR
jgi:mannose-1-phosphate guanylyltransferase/mannose-1-phosphate guanylyltransferase/mannose-6-phosphate isomerase